MKSKIISKSNYKHWEQEIISTFYNISKIKTALIPTNNNASILQKKKVIIVVDFVKRDNMTISELVTSKTMDRLPKQDYIELYHIGNQTKGKVSLGYSAENNIFQYPAFDVGGLTNYNQTPGRVHNLKTGHFLLPSGNLTTTLETIYSEWKEHAKKDAFYGDLKPNVKKCMESIQDYLLKNSDKYIGAHLKFCLLPVEHRVLVTSLDIEKATGMYLERIFGQGDNAYARLIPSNKDIFCAVTENYITPNMNRFNIQNEYSTY